MKTITAKNVPQSSNLSLLDEPKLGDEVHVYSKNDVDDRESLETRTAEDGARSITKVSLA